MRALPATRVPGLYPAPRTDAADTAGMTTTAEEKEKDAEEEDCVRAFAATARALLGTTAEFAFLLDGDKVVVVECVDGHGAREKYEILK